MMENKCNKTPNKYLDHVYCQSGGENKTYMRSNNNTGTSDFLAMLKENKQLKAMLILHLDLIQEQSDQLVAKDKQLNTLKDELQSVRATNTQLEAQVQELQRQLQRQIKRAATTPIGDLALLSPPPLAKIQNCKRDGASTSPTNIIGECNGKLISKIVLQRVNLPDGTFADSTHSPNSTTTISDTTSEDATIQKPHEENDFGDDANEHTTEESNDANEHDEIPKLHALDLPRGVKPRRPLVTIAKTTAASAATTTPTSTQVQVCVTPPTPSRGKQMPLMLWHAPDMHSDEESNSCGSAADVEPNSTPTASPTPPVKPAAPETPKSRLRTSSKPHAATRQQNQRQQQLLQRQRHRKQKRRCAYLTTRLQYPSREWEDEDEKVCTYEFSQAEAEAIHAEAPMLEIPKWTEHELSPLYCIEGTEDLSDESFYKRHAKLEIDEKRRKKWDVQQIREQRRIEKLKQRHYKNEIQEEQILNSFFPQPNELQSICFVNELPVQAFGEMIPKLNLSTDFMLPWLQQTASTGCASTATTLTATTIPNYNMSTTNLTGTNAATSVEIMANSTASSTSSQAQQQVSKSTFVFLKKRKRQQSSSTGASLSRQRSATATTIAATAVVTASKATTVAAVAAETTPPAVTIELEKDTMISAESSKENEKETSEEIT